ncbi:cyclic nucleotide-binding domain protein (macronuclear) [Tetrahymena thermophila SB210]|uniref:Cyclic nucleotide-binding domain protein n=1 Tax=Tetrahymena thermophila (strain SB210) TaxID=312017 RepID=Q22G28_TETTS|nr:cyclic nucleotide-binding domain protein [Tetrahymena thermophila SB210]EAR84198.2 cyclic nucleotide-binding domain protein [Tetrahymena thermophila SB210]|eukprot:XP_001031861.2 cyclic nucleotide-binding domain protein [Tetrahymena thermophila SB210]
MSMIFMSNSQYSDKKDKENLKYFSFRKQYTFYERERERERNDRISIKSLIQNVKLKTRIRNLIDKLPSRRFHKLDEYHYNLVGDISEKSVNTIQDKDNNSNFEIPIFIHEAQASQMRKLKKLQSLMNKQQQQINTLDILRGIQRNFNLSCIKRAIQYTIGNFPIIDPNSIWKLFWDFCMCVKILILCFICSVRITDIYDSISTYAGDNYTLMVVFIVLQSLDMVICANTGYYQRGRLVKTREDIIKKYIVKNGFTDILTLQAMIFELHRWHLKIGQDQKFSSYTSSYKTYVIVCIFEAIVLLLYFIKGMRITKLLTKLEEQFQVTRKQLNLLQLVKLLVFVLIVSHIFACIWLFVGKNSGLSVTWITAYKLENQPWSTQYIRSQYYASVTMITVGYGDTVPQNDTEEIICMIGMMLTCGVFAYAINSIGSILNELNLENAKRKENMLVISQYMREKNIQRNLQSEVREYLEYYWKEWNETQIEKEQQIISQLSDHLRKELLFQANKTIIHESSLLTHYFSDFFIQKIIHIIKEFKATPNQTIVCSQGPESRKGVVFFVEKGEFDIYHFPMSNIINQDGNSNNENNQMLDQNQANQNNPQQLQFAQNLKQYDQQNFMILKKIKTIGVGESFGFESFFTDNPHKFVVKSKDFCKLLYIDRQDFIDLMRQHSLQEDYEKFCFIRDSLINDNNLTLLGTKCQSCKKFDHSLNDCQYVHYIPNKLNLISRFNVSTDIIERSKKKERWPKKRHRNSLTNIVYYSESALEYIQKNQDYIDSVLNYEEYSFVSSFSDYSEDDYENEIEQSNSSDASEENKFKTDEVQDEEDENEVSFQKSLKLSEADANKNSENAKKDLLIDIQNLNNEAKHNYQDNYIDSAVKKKMSIRDQSFHLKSPESLSYKKASISKQTFNSEKTSSIIDEGSPRNEYKIRYSQLNLNSGRMRAKTINDPPLTPNIITRQSKQEIELKDHIQKNTTNTIQEEQRERRASQINKIQKRLTLNQNTGFNTSVPRKSIQYNQALCFTPNIKNHQTSKDQNIANQQQSHAKNFVFNFVQNNEQKQQMPLIIKHIESIHNMQQKQDGSKFKSYQNSEQQLTLNNQAEGKKSDLGTQNDQYQLQPKQNIELAVIKEGSNRCIKRKENQQQDSTQIQHQQNDYDQQHLFYLQGYQNYKIFDDFEKMHQFKFYYPQYNYDRIIANLKKRRAQILQRYINNTNSKEIESSFIQPNSNSKLQKKLKLQLGITKTISKFQNQVQQSKFFENTALKQSFQESQQTQGSPKKKSIIVNSPLNFNSQFNINNNQNVTSPMNNSQNEVVSICTSNKNNLINDNQITSYQNLNEQNNNDDYNYNKNDIQLQTLSQNIGLKSQTDTLKNSIFNVKFAPLIKKINSNKKLSFKKSYSISSNNSPKNNSQQN